MSDESEFHFADALTQRVRALGHPLCVGLDPHLPQIPALFRRGAMQLGAPETAQAVEDLAHRARTKRLSADELKGGTFTLSNPGRKGNLYGFAIINQPQVGILRIGEIVKRTVVRQVGGNDAIIVRPLLTFSDRVLYRIVDAGLIDGAAINGTARSIRALAANGLKYAHSGLTQSYVFFMIVGAIAVVGFLIR